MALKQTGRKVKSVQKGFQIVEYLQEHDGATLAELCDHFDFARSTAYSYLSTLEAMEYVVKNGDEYRISLKFLSHGTAAKNSVMVSKLADDALDSLARETGCVAWIVVEEHGHAVFLDKSMADDAIQTFGRVSKRTPLHIVAGGKSILAHMPEVDREEIIEKYGLSAMTEHTITDREELLDELERIRTLGYALGQNEAALGVSSIAAPITHEGSVLGSVQLTSLTSRLDDGDLEDVFPPLVTDAADEISNRYGELSE